ncbi:hypothetical protein WOLCODRAFT_150042 [Wolfiporia cocos MD-104 SS10]|uniref:Uncharacterized protein n=1 Tax=Wolfiporia cocos (strain MD-104) TaxID=742152 RepID=A0A2H3JCL2_WOLCO|nr:hypothetical protein WOLCODRAFT_150042 [Wolfiporia cocos MD-104 SS10]
MSQDAIRKLARAQLRSFHVRRAAQHLHTVLGSRPRGSPSTVHLSQEWEVGPRKAADGPYMDGSQAQHTAGPGHSCCTVPAWCSRSLRSSCAASGAQPRPQPGAAWDGYRHARSRPLTEGVEAADA